MNLSFFSKMKKRNIDFTGALENAHETNHGKAIFKASGFGCAVNLNS